MKWSVRNFKGLGSSQINIGQGKVTVLTGVNSSGKSSIIQSLLLAAQSLYGDGKIILNGPLVRLGSAQDLVREGAEDGAIELGLGFEAPADEEFEGKDQTNAHANFSLIPSDIQSSLRAKNIRIETFDPAHSYPLTLGNKNIKKIDKEFLSDLASGLGNGYALHLKSLLDSDRRQLRTYVVMQGLKPVMLVQLSKPDEIFESYRSMMAEILQRFETDVPSRRGDRIGPIREFMKYLRPLLNDSYGDEANTNIGRRITAKSLSYNPYVFDKWWTELEENDRHHLLNSVAEERAKEPYVTIDLNREFSFYHIGLGLLESDLLEKLHKSYLALAALNRSLVNLAERVQYLGPLRDEPRVVWNHWNELARGLPVGVRGEYSAAVLSRSSSREVSYIEPDNRPRKEALAHAVDKWLSYLNIGDNVSSISHGKLGVGLSLTVDGQDRDLTSVGVGVSQALPLVVGFLSAPRNSVFIVEQPELHLHPAVQARLADFLLEARPDMAVVVETHSEALITRIRRRAAEGSVEVANVDITFVEPGKDGSIARILELSEFGDLSEWPKGFLSTGEDDIRAILQAGMKRARGK